MGHPILATLALPSLMLAAFNPNPAAGPPAAGFGAAVLLTQTPGFGGFEPGIVIDHYGNIVVTAHKNDQGNAVSADPSGTVPARAASWLWSSTDGTNFTELVGSPLQAADYGDEGDVTTDDSDHLYFVDTKYGDISITRWKVEGLGKISQEFTAPAILAGQPNNDRPWIVAHGDGTVMYLGNIDDQAVGGPAASGRAVVHMSYDGGKSFGPGLQLPGSGWCRPAADHHRGSRRLFVFCTNDSGAPAFMAEGQAGFTNGSLLSYVSDDDGRTFSRFTVAPYNGQMGNLQVMIAPGLTVDMTGHIWAMYIDETADGKAQVVRLFRSTDGRNWEERIASPGPAQYTFGSVSVDQHGRPAVCYYSSPDTASDWHVYAATADEFDSPFTTRMVTPDSVGDSAFGPSQDFFECAFDPAGRLNVTWTTRPAALPYRGPQTGLVYYARELGLGGRGGRGADAEHPGLPNTGGPPPSLASFLVAAVVMALAWLRNLTS